MKDTRVQRYELFGIFQTQIKSKIEKLKQTALTCPHFGDLVSFYGLTVCEKGRWGNDDPHLTCVFFGKRAYDKEIQKMSTGATNTTFLIESGVQLIFSQNDTGYVAILLYPAAAKYWKCKEESILLKKKVHPEEMLNSRFLNKYWRYLNAYMECTCLEGNPSLRQRFDTWCLRNFKHLIVNKVCLPTKFRTLSNSVGKFVLQVGLSGFVIFLLTFLPNWNRDDILQKHIVSQMDSITSILKETAIQNRMAVPVHDTVSLDLKQ